MEISRGQSEALPPVTHKQRDSAPEGRGTLPLNAPAPLQGAKTINPKTPGCASLARG